MQLLGLALSVDRLAAAAVSAPLEALPQAVFFFFLEQPQTWARPRPRDTLHQDVSLTAICRTGLRTLPLQSFLQGGALPEAPLLEIPRRSLADPLSAVLLSAQPGKTVLGCRARAGCALDCGGWRHHQGYGLAAADATGGGG